MRLKVGDSRMKTRDVIFEAAQPVVATGAEQGAHLAGDMVVIDGKVVAFAGSRINRHFGVAATSTRTTLCRHHRLEFFVRQTVAACAAAILVAGLLLPIVHVFGFAGPAPSMSFGSVPPIAPPSEFFERQKSMAAGAFFPVDDRCVEKIARSCRRIALHREPFIHGARAASVARRLPISFPTYIV